MGAAEAAPISLSKKGIRFADAIQEREPLIAHVSQSETVQFAYGKHEIPKPAELLNAGKFRTLRSATRALPSTRELFEKSSTKNFNFCFPQVYRQTEGR